MVWRFILILVVSVTVVVGLGNSVLAQAEQGKFMTVYDGNTTHVFVSKERTLREALKAQKIEIEPHDAVEPSIDEELVANNYHINIYRARPVVVVDGAVRIKALSAYQTAEQIAKSVGVSLYDGDTTHLGPANVSADGAGLELTVTRALPIVLDLYGKRTTIRTQAKNVGDVLKEKNIILGSNGRVSVPETSPIVSGMEVRVWREGIQTVTIDQEIPPSTKIVYDGDRPIGYRVAQDEGKAGSRSITYQLEVKEGIETSRVEIANIITRAPIERVEVIGLKNNGTGLTQSKGAQYYTDTRGISHRETYYDLDMGVVMQSCGQGGYYSVRPDGAKVDAQGYIIIAANYSNYPKCSLVETSLGLGKVYDTGGFTVRYPDGFDLATDWSNNNGR